MQGLHSSRLINIVSFLPPHSLALSMPMSPCPTLSPDTATLPSGIDCCTSSTDSTGAPAGPLAACVCEVVGDTQTCMSDDTRNWSSKQDTDREVQQTLEVMQILADELCKHTNSPEDPWKRRHSFSLSI